MSRLVPAALLALPILLCTAVPAAAQTALRMRSLPPEKLPITRSAEGHVGSSPVSADALSETYRRARLDELAALRQDLDEAYARDDREGARVIIEDAVARLALLVRQPDIVGDERFADLYRTIVADYELRYGPIEPEMEVAFGDVFAVRDELFSALEGLDNPLDPAIAPSRLPVSTSVPMTVNRVVKGAMEFLLEKRPKVIATWLQRAHTYFPMIEQIFAEEGVPDELKYLGMIESGLNPRARSRARAVGMWQFVSATGRAYDLVIDRWVDERHDPEKATRAAARHLRDLYELHGDWHVALAGYNCSPRCINRAKARARAAGAENPDYWDMYRYLPRETRGYVPNLIATAIMLSDPAAYGIEATQPGFTYEYELVPVRGSLALRDVARMAGTDVETIRTLNPALLRDYLPPSAQPYPLRLPVGASDAFLTAYAELPPEALKPPGEHIVRRGDVLGRIADQYGVSVARLKSDNGLRSDLIRPGQRLVVPVSNYDLPMEVDLAEAEPVLVRYGKLAIRPIVSELDPPERLAAARPPPRRASAVPVVTVSDTTVRSRPDDDVVDEEEDEAAPGDGSAGSDEDRDDPEPEARTRVEYEVRRGDALLRIADRYGVSVKDIQDWNGLRSSRIYPGQTLMLYTNGGAPAATEAGPIVYRVRSGDNLSVIASRNGVSVSDLRSWNDLRGSVIRPGQRLTIYPSGTGHIVRTHRVVRGDNLYDLARRYGVTVTELRSWNDLPSSRIYPGQTLRIVR